MKVYFTNAILVQAASGVQVNYRVMCFNIKEKSVSRKKINSQKYGKHIEIYVK